VPGEHSQAILGECGFEEDEIRDLLSSGVVGSADSIRRGDSSDG
jgi:hypothetical protein